jgi:hypothetical protein
LINRFCDVADRELFSSTAGLANGFWDVADGEVFNGTVGLVNGFCDVAGESCLVVQREWLMGFETQRRRVV